MIKETFSQMGVKKALVIDDELNLLDKNKENIDEILDARHDTEDFSIEEELAELNLNYEEVLSDLEEDKIPPELLSRLKERFPHLFKSKIESLITTLEEIFDGNVDLKYKASKKEEFNTLTKETIIFLDYQLEGSPLKSQDLTNLLSEYDKEDPLLIVFISSNKEFYLGEIPYRMDNPSGRNKYFRGLRNEQKTTEYKNSLYEYIHKGQLNDKQTTVKSLHEISQNLYGGHCFFKLLSHIKGVLIDSSETVLGKFHLLNSRSIQELLLEKVALEGESESAFLLNWISRNISKSVIKNTLLSHNIHRTLEEIGQWRAPFNELHEDEALREIVRDEMWDLTINEKYLPVDFGDVFEIKYNNENYKALLITQPCTLAVRGDGSRSGNLATLLLEEKKKNNGDSLAIIEDWDGNKLIFDLNNTINIPFEALDLTTLDENGEANLQFDQVKDNKIVKLPDQALWSKGYKKMMKELTSKLMKDLEETDIKLFQIGYMWFPYDKKASSYNFPIKRKWRLDTFYSLYVLQKLQSWSGRIGLPLDLKFMNDYEKKKGSIYVNEIFEERELYVKQTANKEIKDIAISVDILEEILLNTYKEDPEYCEIIKDIFKSSELLKYNYSSGEGLVSLIKSSDAISLLQEQKIYIDVQEQELRVDIKVCKFTKCLFDEEDITPLLSDFYLDTRGNLRYHFQTQFLEEMDITKQIPHYSNRVGEISEGIKVFKMDSNIKIFRHKIKGDTLRISFLGQAAATKEL